MCHVRQNFEFAFGGSRADYLAKMVPKTVNIWGSISDKWICHRQMKTFIYLTTYSLNFTNKVFKEKDIDANNIIQTFTIGLVSAQWVYRCPPYHTLLITKMYTAHCTVHCIVHCTAHCIVHCTAHCIVHCTAHCTTLYNKLSSDVKFSVWTDPSRDEQPFSCFL